MKTIFSLITLLTILISTMPMVAAEAPSTITPAVPVVHTTAIQSTMLYLHGRPVPEIKTADVHIVALQRKKPLRNQYVMVKIAIQNSGKANVDIDPAHITLSLTPTSGDSVTLDPMSQHDVAGLAKSIARRAGFATMGLAMGGSMLVDSTYSEYSTTNTYEHSRWDSITDGMGGQIGRNMKRMKQTQLLHSTVLPSDQLVGIVYFQLPKADRKDYDKDHAAVQIVSEGTTYVLTLQ